MKKIMLSAVALAALGTTVNAQSVRFGIKGGANFSTAAVENTTFDTKAPFGIGGYAGGLAEFSFKKPSDKFKAQLEVNYDFYNLRTKYATPTGDVIGINRVHAISVPLVGKYFITPSFSVFLGPSFNFNLASNANTKSGSVKSDKLSTKDDLNTFQLGGVVGANYYIVKGFFVEARYNYITPELYKSSRNVSDFGAIHNIQVGVGYKF
ncbi:hypothetical protein DBR32_05060 [Taibaiella sp. KBW10]|uniref:porin family protein n=1 Tax=Taibaiella sp. KBW10 TaxID=2153357 RepID=UPI000F5AEA9E|nr:porin family protein [Taibaiella sp. KBW10]RQO31336.1 hypothetical protein DBR32_05060 [Taibaiella sp. KBW10]